MPVFHNQNHNVYALVSLKVLSTKFVLAPQWKKLAPAPTPRVWLKSILLDHSTRTFFLIRSPYSRTISCFKDKFRKHPALAGEARFMWQDCQRLVFPYCGIRHQMHDQEIAERLSAFSFEQFLTALGEIYKQDVHFHPQYWSGRLHVGKRLPFNWPACNIIKLEDTDALEQIPDIDFSIRVNSTIHIQQDFELSKKNKEMIRSLYLDDFKLGQYSR